jgi:HrpA-like RNA helicase
LSISKVGLDSGNQSENTIILYVTPGVALRKMLSIGRNAFCQKVTHFVLDEVHERGKDLDFLLLLFKLMMLDGNFSPKVCFPVRPGSSLFTV